MIQHGLVDRLLHVMALHNHRFRQFSFEQECRRNGAEANPQREHLFIAGMARAGSTELLNCLFQSGQFAATTYAQMPFVLAPSMARRMAPLRRRGLVLAERAHADGIRISSESPEALDGIFWSTFLPHTAREIAPREVPDSILQAYAKFIENQLAENSRQRYLCKMNQGIDKLESLAAYFSRSIFLVPFRQPLQQAASLLRQHRRFAHLSWYERRYLDWQQHHEFGQLHRGFTVHAAPSVTDNLNYWLRQWLQCYRYLSDLCQGHSNLLLLGYESLATSPQAWQQLERIVGFRLKAETFGNKNRNEPGAGEPVDPTLHDACERLYADLCLQSAASLC